MKRSRADRRSKRPQADWVAHEFQNAMALMSIIPLLGFTYLIAHIAGFDAFLELRGLIALTITVVSLLGVLLGRSLLAEILSRLEEANAELARANQMKDSFLTNVAHEAGNSIAVVKGSLESIKAGQRGAVSDEIQRVTDVCLRQTSHLVRMVNDLLDIAKIERGKFSIELVRTDLANVIRDALEHAAAFKGEHLLVERLPKEAMIVEAADGGRLTEVLINLIKNAMKYSPEGSNIVISAKQAADHYEISVIDHGDGVPDDMKERIFDPFTRYTTRKVSGVGLGLAIARHIVSEHGGRLWVEDNPSGGSVFKFTVPIIAKK